MQRSPSPPIRTKSRPVAPTLAALGVLASALCAAFVACDPSTDEESVPPRILADDGGVESGIVVNGDAAVCAVACGDAGACCSGSCTSPAWDTDNCGSCGVSCKAASPTNEGACVERSCVGLEGAGTSFFLGKPADVVLSGSVLYADLPTAGAMPIRAIDLGAQAANMRGVPAAPTTLPVADGRGGIYYFESAASAHVRVMHYDWATNVAALLDDLGAGALPHVLVRQGTSVARIFSPTIGLIRTVCGNGTVHDLMQSSGVAYAAADDNAVYFGFGSPVTPAVRVACEEGGAVTSLTTTFGHVVAVDAKNTYWFGVDLTMDASKVEGIFASASDGASRARLIARPPSTSSLVTFPLLTGSTLYFVYGVHLPSGTPINVLASVDVTPTASGAGPTVVHAHLSSASPIALDPAFAYTTSAASATDTSEHAVRLPLVP